MQKVKTDIQNTIGQKCIIPQTKNNENDLECSM